MWPVFKKEIATFFSSIIGYVVLIVFLMINSLFLWIVPGDANILSSGIASLDPFFSIAPLIFLFLVPAITMRLIADEKKSRTLELLLTKPISDIKIILAKYFAGVFLVLIALALTTIYVYSVYVLGIESEGQPSNIDMGGTLCSYLGLFFLASIYVAIGLFSSSLTENQIVAFIISGILSFTFYQGIDNIASLGFAGETEAFIRKIGIYHHYESISRGVIDTRDIIYYLSMITGFIFLTKLVFESRKW
jgi:ABC-2 type transport system permease protein